MRGQLGNQLFQIATTLAYAWDNDAHPIFPDLNIEDQRDSSFGLRYNRDRFFFRLDASEPSRPVNNLYGNWDIPWHNSDFIPFQEDLRLVGYLMSWKRFNHYRDKILEILSPSPAVLSHLTKKYSDLISNPHTVSVHVRTYAPHLHTSKVLPFLGLEYYRRALERFPSDSTFVVFSDRINWCKVHFPALGKSFIFVEGNDRVEDLFLMSMMRHHIIANSTFSWWAAYLSQNPNKIIVAPESWMHPDTYAYPLRQPNDFYLPDWLMVGADYGQPYPEDMTWYDQTNSLDGN